LNAIQAQHGWLPREELEALSRRTNRPLYEIQGLVSFYPFFRTDPSAPARVDVCHDLPCWLAGGDASLADLRQTYGNVEDVAITEVSCLGRCDIAPAVAVNDHPAPVDDTAALVTAARSALLENGPPRALRRLSAAPRSGGSGGVERATTQRQRISSTTFVVADTRFVVGEEDLPDEVASTAHAGLVEHAVQVLLRGVGGHDQLLGDLRRRAPLQHESGDVLFAFGQSVGGHEQRRDARWVGGFNDDGDAWGTVGDEQGTVEDHPGPGA
jgi:hypothetical protein